MGEKGVRMGYQYLQTSKWIKEALWAFASAIIAILSAVLMANQIGGLEYIVFVIAIIPVALGIIQGFHYMNRPNQDYIYLASDELEINKGPLRPSKTINYRDIDHCDEFHDYDRIVVTIVRKDRKEIMIHGEWLSDNDFAELKQELINRTCNEKLFRYRVDSKMI